MADEQEVDYGDNHVPTEGNAAEEKLALEAEELARVTAEKEAAEEANKADLEAAAETAKNLADGAKTEEVEDEKGEDEKRSKVIPRERFDAAQRKAQAREEALKAKIEEMEKVQSANKQSADLAKVQEALDAAHDKYEDAVIEGDKEKARTFRKELTRLQDVMIEVKTNVSSAAAKRETIAELRYDAALAKAESEHPELNPDSDKYDASLTDEVGVLLEAFVLKGFNRDVALQKAVRYVVGDPVKKDPDVINDPKKVAEERAAAARAKAAEAIKKQPPAALNKAGLDSDKAGKKTTDEIDVMKMTYNQFLKLDEAALAKARGDTLE